MNLKTLAGLLAVPLWVVSLVLVCSQSAMASSSFYGPFSTLYPASSTGTNSGRCNLCHSSGGDTDLNPYGKDWADRRNAGRTNTQAYQDIEQLNSDGAGGNNIAEINANAQPGWTSGQNQLYDMFTLVPSHTAAAPTITGGLLDSAAANVAPVLTNPGNRNVNEGVLLQFTITATDDGPVTALVFGGTVPAGATLTDNHDGTATFTWTPSFTQGSATPYPVTITVTDPEGLADSQSFDVTVGNVNQPPAITTATLPAGKGGVAYSLELTATGGVAPYTWTQASGTLPPGLTLSPSGVLAGKPLAAGLYSFRIRVTGFGGDYSEQDFTLTIDPFRRYFAEGASSGFFDCYFALANPSATTAATVTLTFLRSDSQTFVHTDQVAPLTRRTVNVKDVPGMWPAPAFSTVMESNIEVVADRTMSWQSVGYGSHAESSIREPAQTWYLAEGATQNGFQLYYCIENPNADPVDVEVTYLRASPNPPIAITYLGIPGNTRKTIYVNGEDTRLAWGNVSGVVTSLTPGRSIIVERAMYQDSEGVMFNAGHASAGVTAPATNWFLAEGATVGTFDMFITLANPGAVAGAATVTYMLTDGRTVVKTYAVPASSRQTVWVNGERDDVDPTLTLSWVSLSAKIQSTVPIIVERSMWWSAVRGGPWIESTNAVATTETGTLWAAADGEQDGVRNTDTYVLVANTSPFPGRIRVTTLGEDGTTQWTERDVPANSRTTLWTGGTAVTTDSPFGGLLTGKKFGVIVESLAAAGGTAQIVVERAMYSDANGVVWAAGTGVVATKLK